MPWYVDIDQGIHKGKMKVALKEKQKKLHGFSFSINIANFKAFLSVFKLTKNPLFRKSVWSTYTKVWFVLTYNIVKNALEPSVVSTYLVTWPTI